MSNEKEGRSRVWISWYNRPRVFDNGIVWFRVSVRLRRWHPLGGLWFSRTWPFVRVLPPQSDGPRGPLRRP
jgi:hypothetical protein